MHHRIVLCVVLSLSVLEGCAGPDVDRGVPDDGDPHDLAFLITALSVPGSEDGLGVGADLDGRDTDPDARAPSTCEELSRDFESRRHLGERGIDDAASTLIPIVDEVLGNTLDDRIARAMSEGRLSMIVEVRGVRAQGDGEIEVVIHSARSTEAGLTLHELARAPGRITGTRVRARFDALAIPIDGAPIRLLPLDALGETELVLDLALDAQGARVLRNAELGTSLPIQAIVEDVRSTDPLWVELASEMLAMSADLVPSTLDPMICERISIGLALEGNEIEIAR